MRVNELRCRDQFPLTLVNRLVDMPAMALKVILEEWEWIDEDVFEDMYCRGFKASTRAPANQIRTLYCTMNISESN